MLNYIQLFDYNSSSNHELVTRLIWEYCEEYIYTLYHIVSRKFIGQEGGAGGIKKFSFPENQGLRRGRGQVIVRRYFRTLVYIREGEGGGAFDTFRYNLCRLRFALEANILPACSLQFVYLNLHRFRKRFGSEAIDLQASFSKSVSV